jgi:hypothetical protein
VETDVLILALQLGRREFVERFPEPLLVGDGAFDSRPDLQHQETAPPRSSGEVLPTHIVCALRSSGRVVSDFVSIGRGIENDIVVLDETISKTHAIFARTAGGGWTLADASSKNGTWVDDQRLVDSPVPVQPGNRIRLGDVWLTLVDSGAFWERLRKF